MQQVGNKEFSDKHIVFMDKNHPSNAIDKVLDEIIDNLPGNVQGRYLYMIPDCDQNLGI